MTTPSSRIVELFDPTKNYQTANSAQLTYRGGPLLANVELFAVYIGAEWIQEQAIPMQRMNDYLSFLATSDVIANLAEYSTPQYTIAGGSFKGSFNLNNGDFGSSSITDERLREIVNGLIQDKSIPQPTANTLYLLFLPNGISIVGSDGSASCVNFCGYHDSQGQVYYAPLAYPGCDGCLGGLQPFDALCATASHEICEAITDPVPGQGWYDDTNGEIGDICAWQFRTSGNYTVQTEWSNRANTCV